MPQRAFTDRPGHKCDKCGRRVSLQFNQNHQGVLCVINAKTKPSIVLKRL